MTRPIALLAALALAMSVTATSHAGVVVKAPVAASLPQGPCNEDHILDIEIINGVWYECSCEERVFTDNDCGWQELLWPAHDPHAYPKLLKRTKKIMRVKGGYLYVPRVRPVF